MKSKTTSPFYYAVGMFLGTPVAAILYILMAIGLLLAWPIMPFLAYAERKKELRVKVETEKAFDKLWKVY